MDRKDLRLFVDKIISRSKTEAVDAVQGVQHSREHALKYNGISRVAPPVNGVTSILSGGVFDSSVILEKDPDGWVTVDGFSHVLSYEVQPGLPEADKPEGWSGGVDTDVFGIATGLEATVSGSAKDVYLVKDLREATVAGSTAPTSGFPRMTYYWPGYESDESVAYPEVVSKYDAVVGQEYEHMTELKGINPSITTIFNAGAAEVNWDTPNCPANVMMQGASPQWFLTQKGTTLSAAVTSAATTIPVVANLTTTRRFYPTSNDASFYPATLRGTWEASDELVRKTLSTTKLGAGAINTTGVDLGASRTDYDQAHMQLVSDALSEAKSVTIGDCCLGVRGNNCTARAHIYAYVTSGSSDAVRGVLVNDWVSSATWTSTATGLLMSPTSSTVSALAGDRVVVVVGSVASNTDWGYTYINYGGASSIDLTNGGNPALYPSWFDITLSPAGLDCFSVNDLVLVGNELMQVTGISGLNLTVTRGSAYSTITSGSVNFPSQYGKAAHSSGDRIAAVCSQYRGAISMDCTTLCPKVDVGLGSAESWADFNVRKTAGILAGTIASDPTSQGEWDAVWFDVSDGDKSKWVSWLPETNKSMAMRNSSGGYLDTPTTDQYESFDLSWNEGMVAQVAALRTAIGNDKYIVGNGSPAECIPYMNGNYFEEYFSSTSQPEYWYKGFVGPKGYDSPAMLPWQAAPGPDLSWVRVENSWTASSGQSHLRYILCTAALGSSTMLAHNTSQTSTLWMDEFDNAGSGKGYLGAPLGDAYSVNSPSADILSGDGSFTSGGYANWGLGVASGSAATTSNTSGALNVNVSVRNNYTGVYAYHSVSFTPGHYALTFKAKASTRYTNLSDPTNGLVVEIRNTTTDTAWVMADARYITTEWREYLMQVDVTETGNGQLRFYLGDADGDLWLDDVELIKLGSMVWRRDFEGGVVLVNAETTSQTVALGEQYQKIDGTQDPTINDGSVVDHVVVGARDGLILLSQSGSVSSISNEEIAIVETVGDSTKYLVVTPSGDRCTLKSPTAKVKPGATLYLDFYVRGFPAVFDEAKFFDSSGSFLPNSDCLTTDGDPYIYSIVGDTRGSATVTPRMVFYSYEGRQTMAYEAQGTTVHGDLNWVRSTFGMVVPRNSYSVSLEFVVDKAAQPELGFSVVFTDILLGT